MEDYTAFPLWERTMLLATELTLPEMVACNSHYGFPLLYLLFVVALSCFKVCAFTDHRL